MTPRPAWHAVDGTSREVSSIADTQALPALVVLVATAGVLTLWLRRSGRTKQEFSTLFASLASICLILAVTLCRVGWPHRFSIDKLTEWSRTGFDRLRSDPFGSSQFILNIALFVPAGAAWAWMTRRPIVSAAALVVGSLLVESVQAVTGLGAPDLADVMANSIGAFIGVGAATLVSHARARRPGATLSPRRRATIAAVVVGVCAVALTLVLVGADRRQRSIELELQTAFEGTTRADIDRWNADGTMLDEVFDAVSVFADGTEYSPEEVMVRYPASFYGLHRCVFVVWTETSVRFERESGDVCIDFMG